MLTPIVLIPYTVHVYQSPCPNATGQANLPLLDGDKQPELVFYPPLEILMETAILTPSGNGTTPIEAIFSSLSPLFDSDSMCLYVSNMPMNYTAQQLLKLFQTRYPSAYKAEMFKVNSLQDVMYAKWSNKGLL